MLKLENTDASSSSNFLAIKDDDEKILVKNLLNHRILSSDEKNLLLKRLSRMRTHRKKLENIISQSKKEERILEEEKKKQELYIKHLETLVLKHHWRFIHRKVKKYFKLSGISKLSKLEILQAGGIGFLKALRRFDPTKGFQLTSYTPKDIQGYVIRCLRKAIHNFSPIYVAQKREVLSKAENKFNKEYPEQNFNEKIPELLNISTRDFNQYLDELGFKISRAKSLFSVQPGNKNKLVVDGILDFRQAESEIDLERLVTALSELTENERKVIALRFGLNLPGVDVNYANSHSQDEIARIMKLSNERIRQIEEKALSKLAEPMADHNQSYHWLSQEENIYGLYQLFEYFFLHRQPKNDDGEDLYNDIDVFISDLLHRLSLETTIYREQELPVLSKKEKKLLSYRLEVVPKTNKDYVEGSAYIDIASKISKAKNSVSAIKTMKNQERRAIRKINAFFKSKSAKQIDDFFKTKNKKPKQTVYSAIAIHKKLQNYLRSSTTKA